ncbi:hypothetical protein QBC32DRAFT_40543 [Pseudoneurospora amorphoporcata]|uniref:Secreted protein n=1 Tax=Pseudoneurospora amorphoporcata TaxID=241081 RepID=A0AAN6NSS6_9PEZI|nr:hypothetical protein QBC32DRAFT_40543 [Pseudoneurospora amorphoporcata]
MFLLLMLVVSRCPCCPADALRMPCGFRAPFSIRVRPSVTHNSPFPILHSESVLAVDERDAGENPMPGFASHLHQQASSKHKTRVQTAEQQCPYRKVVPAGCPGSVA